MHLRNEILYLVTFRIWISHVLCLNSTYKSHERAPRPIKFIVIPWNSHDFDHVRWPTNPISILVLWRLILKVCLRSLFGLVSTRLWFSFDFSSGIAADSCKIHWIPLKASLSISIISSRLRQMDWPFISLLNRLSCLQVFLFPRFHRCLIC